MPTYRADLSVSSLDDLLRNVTDYKSKLQAVPEPIVSELATIGRQEIELNMSGISDKDGNVLAEAGQFTFGDTGFAYMQGGQAAFLEYGTGLPGADNPHPQAALAGWKYDSGSTIRTTKAGRRIWRYRESGTGKWRLTDGIPAQMPVLRAALTMRRNIVKVAKGALK